MQVTTPWNPPDTTTNKPDDTVHQATTNKTDESTHKDTPDKDATEGNKDETTATTTSNRQDDLDKQRGNGSDETSVHSPYKPDQDFTNMETTPPTVFASDTTLNTIGFIEHVDNAPSPPFPPPIPSLPHAALDDSELPATTNERTTPRNKQAERDASMAIDMHEEEGEGAHPGKRIAKLGNGRRWKLCFLF